MTASIQTQDHSPAHMHNSELCIYVHVIGAVALVLVSIVVRRHGVQLPAQVALAARRSLTGRPSLSSVRHMAASADLILLDCI
jgi:hypothetical protein